MRYPWCAAFEGLEGGHYRTAGGPETFDVVTRRPIALGDTPLRYLVA